MLKIAIDAMGGDFGPEPIIEGLVAALKKICGIRGKSSSFLPTAIAVKLLFFYQELKY